MQGRSSQAKIGLLRHFFVLRLGGLPFNARLGAVGRHGACEEPPPRGLYGSSAADQRYHFRGSPRSVMSSSQPLITPRSRRRTVDVHSPQRNWPQPQDGTCSTVDAHDRWEDLLAVRLVSRPGSAALGNRDPDSRVAATRYGAKKQRGHAPQGRGPGFPKPTAGDQAGRPRRAGQESTKRSDRRACPQGPAAIRLHGSGVNVRWASPLGRQLTELAILTTAREHDQPYEWSLHEMEAVAVGLDPAVIDIVRHRRPSARSATRKPS